MSGANFTGVKVEECIAQEPNTPVSVGIVRPVPVRPHVLGESAFPALDLVALAFGAPAFVALALPVHPLSVEEKKQKQKQKRKPVNVSKTARIAYVYVDGVNIGSATIQMQRASIVVFFLGGVITSGLNATWEEFIPQMRDLYLVDKKLGPDKIKIVVRVLPKAVRSAKLLANNKSPQRQPGTVAKEDHLVATIFANAKSINAQKRPRATNGRMVKANEVKEEGEEVQVKQE